MIRNDNLGEFSNKKDLVGKRFAVVVGSAGVITPHTDCDILIANVSGTKRKRICS